MSPAPRSVNPVAPRGADPIGSAGAGSGPKGSQPKRVLLERLRARLARLEPLTSGAAAGLPFGVPAIDAALPGGGLARGCIHELCGPPDQGAAAGFAAALLGQLLQAGGHAVWIAPRAELYAPGLVALGLPPERLLTVHARARDARLWALEEALRTPGLIAALAEVDRLSLTQSRRLQLAAEAKGVTGLLLRPPGARPTASAAVTRWQITPVRSGGTGGGGRGTPGAPRWRVELFRCRGGRTGNWQVTWDGERWHEIADSVSLVAVSGNRAVA